MALPIPSGIKEIAYKVLHILTLGRGLKITVNGFTLRFPTRYFRRFPANYEADNYEFLRKHCGKGQTVIDVGAHLGLFSICAWQCTGRTGKVYSFEPTRTTFDLLQETIRINGARNHVKALQAAVADQKGKVTFYIGEAKTDVANSLVADPERKRNSYEVPMVALDEFVEKNNAGHIDFIKIDAEGAELSVLKGARKILTEHRPVCILGMHPSSIYKFGDSAKAIWDFIRDVNYRVEFNETLMEESDFCERSELFEVHLLPIEQNG